MPQQTYRVIQWMTGDVGQAGVRHPGYTWTAMAAINAIPPGLRRTTGLGHPIRPRPGLAAGLGAPRYC